MLSNKTHTIVVNYLTEHEIISGFLIVHSVGLSVKVNKSHKIVIREDTDGDELNIRPPINK